MSDGLIIDDLVTGDGAEATPGKRIEVHDTGWLYNPSAKDNKGGKFDSSVDRGETFSFLLGAGQVIQGWDKGFAGMKIGGLRRLTIPSEMGYGASGSGSAIPPHSVLVFDVELISVG